MFSNLEKFLTRLARRIDGNVTVELALVMSVFALVMVGGYDFSSMAVEKHKLEQYARAGVQWGLLNQGSAVDQDKLIEVTKSAAGNDADDIDVTATNYCECPEGSIGCSDTCAGGEVPDLFVAITVTKQFDYLFELSAGIGGDVTLTGTATMRVR